MSDENQERINENQALIEKCKQLETKNYQLNEKNQSLEKEKQQFMDRIKRSSPSGLAKLEKDIKKKTEEYDIVKYELNLHKRNQDEIKTQLKNLEERNRKLISELNSIKAELSAISVAKQTLEDELKDELNKKAIREKQVSDLDIKLRISDSDLEAIKEQMRELQKESSSYKNELRLYTDKSEAEDHTERALIIRYEEANERVKTLFNDDIRLNIIEMVKKSQYVTPERLIEYFGIPKETLNSYIDVLLKVGCLKKVGSGSLTFIRFPWE